MVAVKVTLYILSIVILVAATLLACEAKPLRNRAFKYLTVGIPRQGKDVVIARMFGRGVRLSQAIVAVMCSAVGLLMAFAVGLLITSGVDWYDLQVYGFASKVLMLAVGFAVISWDYVDTRKEVAKILSRGGGTSRGEARHSRTADGRVRGRRHSGTR